MGPEAHKPFLWGNAMRVKPEPLGWSGGGGLSDSKPHRDRMGFFGCETSQKMAQRG